MTENDYIAEYVKERHPSILGSDYAIWKMGRQVSELASDTCRMIVDTLNSIDWSEVDWESIRQSNEVNADDRQS